jgi:hypothetical protein
MLTPFELCAVCSAVMLVDSSRAGWPILHLPCKDIVLNFTALQQTCLLLYYCACVLCSAVMLVDSPGVAAPSCICPTKTLC